MLIVFVFGIIGIPSGLTGTALKQSILDRIHLGLDLKGGTHLILQVMVDEAVSIADDNDAAHIQQRSAAERHHRRLRRCPIPRIRRPS